MIRLHYADIRRMRQVMLKKIGLAVCLSATLTPALGHHSFGMFDLGAQMTLEGTIRRFDWKNPHVLIWLDTEAEDGAEPEIWGIETTTPGNLMRAGWTKRSLNPGDQVSITISPLRSGNKGGVFRSVQNLTTGETLEYDYVRLGQRQDESDDGGSVDSE